MLLLCCRTRATSTILHTEKSGVLHYQHVIVTDHESCPLSGIICCAVRSLEGFNYSLIQRTSSMTAIGHIQFNILLNDYMCNMSRLGLGGTS